jgi:predicted alpha/beta-hydrolase family hydrolase
MAPQVYPSDNAIAALILAHGAGAGQGSAFMVRAAQGLAARRVTVATFDFPYMAARRKVPDAAPALERSWRDIIEHARADDKIGRLPMFIGGKSMGGRIASHVAAQGVDALAGLVFLGYPLHPPGKPEQRRDAHLPDIREPMLFVQGERDAFGTAREIRELLPRLNGRTALHDVAGGDHSFKVPAKGGRPQNQVFEEIFDAVALWIQETR